MAMKIGNELKVEFKPAWIVVGGTVYVKDEEDNVIYEWDEELEYAWDERGEFTSVLEDMGLES